MESKPRRRVLVVEDERAWQKLICDLIGDVANECHYAIETVVVDSFAEASAAIATPFNCITVDNKLRDGTFATVLLDRIASRGENVSVVVISGAVNQAEVRDFFVDYRIDDFFWKNDLNPRLFKRTLVRLLTQNTLAPQAGQVDFVMVTALEDERDSILGRLFNYRRLPPSDVDVHVYYTADLDTAFPDGSTGTYRIVLMPLPGMGQRKAGPASVDAIRRWRPRYVVLVGIAGGVAAKGVRLGDILVADQIVDYELQKVTPNGPQIRWEVHRTNERLLEFAGSFADTSWRELIKAERPETGLPTRHVGPIASGDKVIAFGQALAALRDDWPALIGVEMEAAGVATAAFQAAHNPGFFMVRGVSDLADEEKDSGDVQRWRAYACDIAASYAIGLLKSGPVPVSPWT
jgi:nucleoside phosphorylase/CheY-like chemotaxis protein